MTVVDQDRIKPYVMFEPPNSDRKFLSLEKVDKVDKRGFGSSSITSHAEAMQFKFKKVENYMKMLNSGKPISQRFVDPKIKMGKDPFQPFFLRSGS